MEKSDKIYVKLFFFYEILKLNYIIYYLQKLMS